MQIGIDYGTCATCAVIRDGRRRIVVRNPIDDSTSIPTSIYVDRDGKVLIGSRAENKKLIDMGRYRDNIKSDLNRTDTIEHGGREFTGVEMAAEFLTEIKKLAQSTLVNDAAVFDSVVFTVPAYYGEEDKKRMIEAGVKSGFDPQSITLIEEPVGAAVAYIQDEQGLAEDDTILVYDFGGGTFDSAIVKKTKEGFETIGSAGVPRCGGIRFNQTIAADIALAAGETIDALLSSYESAMDRLQVSSLLSQWSIQVKHGLSDEPEVNVKIDLPDRIPFEYTLTRMRFNEMIAPIVEETISCCRELIAHANLPNGQDSLAGVLLVGGSSHVPYVAEAVTRALSRPLFVVADPKLVVALGAACLGEFGMNECGFCSGKSVDVLPFCPYCRIIRKDLSNMAPHAAEEYRKRLETLSLALRQSPKDAVTVLWDQTVSRYAINMRDARAFAGVIDDGIEKASAGSVFEDAYQSISSFMQQCRDPDFHIAFVGAVKAGKSSLINALFDRELASTSVTPETAALTLFRSARVDSIQVTFYSDAEWAALWATVPQEKDREGKYTTVFMEEYADLNADSVRQKHIGSPPLSKTFPSGEELRAEIQKWTSSKQPEHYFVKRVDVGLADFSLPSQVVLVDTPGLDDPVAYRSDVTKNYIARANAVLVCVNASGALTGRELTTIYGVFDNTPNDRSKVYIVGTQMDKCSSPEADWALQKASWIKHIKGARAYGSLELARENTVGVAALYYTILTKRRRGELLVAEEKRVLHSHVYKYDMEPDQIQDHLEELIAMTHIDELRQTVMQELVGKYKYWVLRDIRQSYSKAASTIKSTVGTLQENQAFVLQSHDLTIETIQSEIKNLASAETQVKDAKSVVDSVKKSLEELAARQAASVREKLDALKV